MNRPSPAETKLLICVWHPFSEWRPKPILMETIRKRWPAMRVVHLPDFEGLPEQLPDTDIFVGASLRPEQFALAKQLKWIHSTAAGVSQFMYPDLRASRIVMTNAKGIFSVPMAEHTMGMMLALARNLPDTVRLQDKEQWGQQVLWNQYQQLAELNGQLLLIVGYGSIGQEVARRARAFNMRVWGVTRSGHGDTTLAERIVPTERLDTVLPEADYVLCVVPDTADTHHLIGQTQLSKMKSSARLLNIGRGTAIDEDALLQALKAGTIAGAAIDVAVTEPLPPESPLWTAPRLLITPHVSGASSLMWERETALLASLLEKWFAGEELFNRVDLSRGY